MREDRKAYNQEYREKNKEKLKAYRQQYYAANKERCDAYKKKWVQNNPDKRIAAQEKYNASIREYRESCPQAFLSKLLNRTQNKHKSCHKSSKEKYQQWDLTLEFLVELWDKQEGKCALTGKTMTHKFKSMFAASIDRIESSKGYLQGNVQLLCQAVNYAKNNFTNADFLHFWNSNEEKVECEKE